MLRRSRAGTQKIVRRVRSVAVGLSVRALTAMSVLAMTVMIVRRVVTAMTAHDTTGMTATSVLAMTVMIVRRVVTAMIAHDTTGREPSATIARGAIAKNTTVDQLAETAPIGLHAQSVHLVEIVHSTTA